MNGILPPTLSTRISFAAFFSSKIRRADGRGNKTPGFAYNRVMSLLRFALALTLVVPGSLALAAPPKKATTAKPATKPAQSDVKQLLAGAPKPEQWPNASKVTMHDFADVTIRPDGSSRTVTRQTIRIFAARARDEGEIKIPYNGAFETIKLVRARTIRPNGQVVEVKPADVRSAAPSDYDDAKVLSFSMPAVEPGAILDYEYVTDQKASQLPGHHWSQWYFQSGFDPVLHTRLTVNIPKALNIRTLMRNAKVEPKKQVSADGQRTLYTWESKNLDALFTEPLMPDMERTLPKLTYSTLPDWQVIAKWYETLAEGRATADPQIKQRALEVTKGKDHARGQSPCDLLRRPGSDSLRRDRARDQRLPAAPGKPDPCQSVRRLQGHGDPSRRDAPLGRNHRASGSA